MKPLFFTTLLLLVSGTAFAQQDRPLPKLEIKRDFKAKETAKAMEVVDESNLNPDELITQLFIVPPTFLSQGGATREPVDPFADDVRKNTGDRLPPPTAKGVLEHAGVSFGEGASAVYNPSTSRLIVRQTREQMELVHAYVDSGSHIESQIIVRFEVYELPSLMGLEALESAEQYGNHKPERDAIHKLVFDGKAKLVTAISMHSRSGQRSKVEDGNRLTSQVGYELPILPSAKDDDGDALRSPFSTPIPKFEEKLWGTIAEIDPVLGADQITLDLNVSFEHHTAPPSVRTGPILLPHTGKREEVEFHEFHAKQITTQISIMSGSYQLIGNWKPTGKPEHENADQMQLVFIHAIVQPIHFSGEIEILEGSDSASGKKE